MIAERRERPDDNDGVAALPLALQNVEVSDEDPALFWGPDWREKFD